MGESLLKVIGNRKTQIVTRRNQSITNIWEVKIFGKSRDNNREQLSSKKVEKEIELAYGILFGEDSIGKRDAAKRSGECLFLVFGFTLFLFVLKSKVFQ